MPLSLLFIKEKNKTNKPQKTNKNEQACTHDWWEKTWEHKEIVHRGTRSLEITARPWTSLTESVHIFQRGWQREGQRVGGEERGSSERLWGGRAAPDSERQLLSRLAQVPACHRTARRCPRELCLSAQLTRGSEEGSGEPRRHLPRLRCLSEVPWGPWKAERHAVHPAAGEPVGNPAGSMGRRDTRGPRPCREGGGGDGFQPKPPRQLLPNHTPTLLREQAACQTPSLFPRCNLVGFLTSRSYLVTFSLSLEGRNH